MLPTVRPLSDRRRDLVPLARVAVAVVLVGHGLIHLLGVLLLWHIAEPGGLGYTDFRPESGTVPGVLFGLGWLIATIGFTVAGMMVSRRARHWEWVTVGSVAVSVLMLLPSASTAAPGLALNAIILALVGSTSRLLKVGGSTFRPTKSIRSAWSILLKTHYPQQVFDVGLVSELPEPARRWLTHSIEPGTPLWTSVELSMVGQIKIKSWRPFVAHQAISPAGYIWTASTSMFGLPVGGFDRYTCGTGQMRWLLGGLIPVVSVDGADVSRSAAGRLASESVFYPTAFQQASWRMGDNPDQAIATWTIDGRDHQVEITVAHNGRLRSVVLSRWGNPGGAPFGLYPFGVTMTRELTFQGVTIPVECTAGWFWGTDKSADGEFFRAGITSAVYS